MDGEKPSETSSINGEDKLRQVVHLITSLIMESHTIRVFSMKWQLIRAKLEELNSGLVALDSCHSTIDNQQLLHLISSVLLSVNVCWDLARRCIEVSYSGKLLMQSDLDKVYAKFDAQAKNLTEIYSAGVSLDGMALMVAQPGLGASRDDMRFYVRDLLTRLKIGSIEMKKQVLFSLNEVVAEDEKYVKIVVEMDDMLIVLACLLDSVEPDLQEEAANMVSVIAGFGSFKGLLIGVGIIAPLVRVLECGSCKAKEFAVESLMKLTENGDSAWSLSAHGGVTALLNICTSTNGESGEGLAGRACEVLRNLVGIEEIKRFMIEEGAILTFIKLLSSSDELTQINSIECLLAIASEDDSTCQMIIDQEGISELVRVLDPRSSSSYKSRESALRAIESLFFASSNSLSLLVSPGFMDHLLYFIRQGDASIQEWALKAASRLSRMSEETRNAMGDAGFILEFVKFLESMSYSVRETAAEAISNMVTMPKNRKKVAQDDKIIDIVLRSIDPRDIGSGTLKFLLCAVLLLSNCNVTRKKIINSKYMRSIEQLAENGVPDAKKIIRNLTKNRFQAMLNRMLHSR